MLDVLIAAEAALPGLLAGPVDAWESLDVDYEPPRVERLWRPFQGRYRLYLHRIHPCEVALLHPHPWPSAIRVISGQYEMQVRVEGRDACKLILTAGSAYEMTDPFGWHSVRPLGEPSLSVMVTGEPYSPQVYDHSEFGKKQALGPLSDPGQLLGAFREHYGVSSRSSLSQAVGRS